MYLTDNPSVIPHHIVHLPLIFADAIIHTIELWVIPALDHAIILGMPFLYTLDPPIGWKTHTITW